MRQLRLRVAVHRKVQRSNDLSQLPAENEHWDGGRRMSTNSQQTQTDDENRPLTNVRRLTGFQRDLLAVVAGNGPCTGQTIKSTVEDAGYGDINHGRLYPNLDTLVNKGLVNKEYAEPDGRSNTYTVTPDGIGLLNQKWQWTRDQVAGLDR